MDDFTAQLLLSLASNYFTTFTAESVKQFFSAAFTYQPQLERELRNAKSSSDFEKVFAGAVGVIDANAKTGAINVNGALLEALRGIRFDHAQGTVNIAGSVVRSELLKTGGSSGATGKTVIGSNTTLQSRGTSISIGNGCGIEIIGNAGIEQS